VRSISTSFALASSGWQRGHCAYKLRAAVDKNVEHASSFISVMIPSRSHTVIETGTCSNQPVVDIRSASRTKYEGHADASQAVQDLGLRGALREPLAV